LLNKLSKIGEKKERIYGFMKKRVLNNLIAKKIKFNFKYYDAISILLKYCKKYLFKL